MKFIGKNRLELIFVVLVCLTVTLALLSNQIHINYYFFQNYHEEIFLNIF